VKTPRGCQPLHDPLASPYWPVARRVLGEHPTQNRFRRRADGPRSEEGEERPAANSSCAVRGARQGRTTTQNPNSGWSANPHVHNSAGFPPSSANRKRLRSMPPPKPVSVAYRAAVAALAPFSRLAA
jgi:hypothetical protein